MEVRTGDRLVSVGWCCASIHPDHRDYREEVTLAQAQALSRLTELVADPTSRLPASAWEDREIRAYVPAKYAICYWRSSYRGLELGPTRWLEPSLILGSLPEAAQDLLRGKDRTYGPTYTPLPSVCSEVTTEEARALDEIFSLAGFVRDPVPRERVMAGPSWNVRFLDPDPHDTIFFNFEPLLPHGEWAPMGG
jgi:hypothetical protein